jgi:carboxypeptidase C (cathepsin A)
MPAVRSTVTSALAICAALFLSGFPALALGETASSASNSVSSWTALRDVARDGPRRFVTDHAGVFDGRRLDYRATVEETILVDAAGRPATSIFTTSYVLTGRGASPQRPVIFVFNGGPGGASDYLHLGGLGPIRMESFTVAAQADPTTRLVPNTASVLGAADLVFIDPPETGWGRPLPGADPKTFRGIDADAYGVGQFILHWLIRNKRLEAPKYLAGESYGGHRSIALARDLPRATPNVLFDGIILIAPGLTYNGPDAAVIRHLPDALQGVGRIQDAAALGWYHGKVDNKGQTLADAIAKAREFSAGEYATAMLEGNRLTPEARRHVAQRLSELTGLTPEYFLQNNLRVGDLRHDLLKDRGLVLDQFDGRETAPASAVPQHDRDRDFEAAFRGVTDNMIAYGVRDLGVKGLERYRTVVPDPYGFEETWQYFKAPADGMDLLLGELMTSQPKLRLLAPVGLFDTTGSAGETEAQLARLPVPAERIAVTYYPAGHMPYGSVEGMRQLNADIGAFVRGTPVAQRVIPQLAPAQAPR